MQLSRASAAIYGLSQGTIEITGKAWSAYIHRDDVDRLRAERLRAFETQQPELVGEFRIVRPGGEVRWIEARTRISYDSAGRASRMVGVYIDVTERMRVERTLLERDAQLDLANQVGRVGGYSYDYATNTLRLGAGTAAIYGLPKGTEEMTAEEWRQCVHPDDLKRLAAESRSRSALRGRRQHRRHQRADADCSVSRLAGGHRGGDREGPQRASGLRPRICQRHDRRTDWRRNRWDDRIEEGSKFQRLEARIDEKLSQIGFPTGPSAEAARP
jgi:PAS domain S-box-containing protein